MRRLIFAAAAVFCISTPAFAALPVGAKAPEFSAPGYQGGKPLTFDLHKALKKGPVVLYFFPAAHTAGCNLEAHLFADSIDKFHAEGATVIGVTAGNIDQLKDFSTETEHCAGKFPVAADQDAVIAKSYDATSAMHAGFSSRTSYVIAPNGVITLSYSNPRPDDHISQTLDAVTNLKAAQRK